MRQEAKRTTLTDLQEKQDEASIANFILFYNEAEANNPKAYEQSYARLRKWIDDSIDAYKVNLLVNNSFDHLSWNCVLFCIRYLFMRIWILYQKALHHKVIISL